MNNKKEREMIPNRDAWAPPRPLGRPTWLPESAWPFQTVGLGLDDSVVAVTDVGRGPVLLFVHVGTWSFIWRDLVTRLSGQFRCVCLDAPGTGRSLDGARTVI